MKNLAEVYVAKRYPHYDKYYIKNEYIDKESKKLEKMLHNKKIEDFMIFGGK